jgi:hypothetical protein
VAHQTLPAVGSEVASPSVNSVAGHAKGATRGSRASGSAPASAGAVMPATIAAAVNGGHHPA